MDAHLAKVDQSALGSKWGAGDIMYADLDGDGKISTGAISWEIQVTALSWVTVHRALTTV